MSRSKRNKEVEIDEDDLDAISFIQEMSTEISDTKDLSPEEYFEYVTLGFPDQIEITLPARKSHGDLFEMLHLNEPEVIVLEVEPED